jgi:hypothetical protein
MKILDTELAREAKAIVAVAFRNGPIEDVHAGKVCPVCSGSPDYSRITGDEMKAMMKAAVNAVYKLLWNRAHDSCQGRSKRRPVWRSKREPFLSLRSLLGTAGARTSGA